MSEGIGEIVWHDLTVENAPEVGEFYQAVVGWQPQAVSMGEYDDFNMYAQDSADPIAGVCHARGSNAELPAQWMMYVRVANVGESVAQVKKLGGKVISGSKSWAGESYYVIQDPAGAVMTIFSKD
jgi:predicted enzyme related to lactoylglutathione lyase